MAEIGNQSLLENSQNPLPVVPPSSGEYEQAKALSFSLQDQKLERLKNDLVEEINRHALERICQRHEREEIVAQELSCQRREQEEIIKGRDHQRKAGERSSKAEKQKGYGSATESDSEESQNGFEYPIEEMKTNYENSDAADERKRMEDYHVRQLRIRFEDERANPNIFSRTMREGEPSNDEEEISEDESDESEESDSEGSSSPDDSQVSPTSSSIDYSEQYA
ncbi:uncharacterized protein LOC113352423 [Papaver somniferum]|uniref:uncharacterized protein LOC113352423 n=1 Tax=Papaver somniferum TaxID=3469 RepID=UPI000E6FDE2B|nr:uncharacterized protein LOC113352423 [Papaver somniferum]